uniref:Uncharacterized protein n=1 Tax=uncultured marine virus TaxID=186617 RepID=A0A0F7L3E0_9VIRU|nr:hypothetical protein [uncultured marine virus]
MQALHAFVEFILQRPRWCASQQHVPRSGLGFSHRPAPLPRPLGSSAERSQQRRSFGCRNTGPNSGTP